MKIILFNVKFSPNLGDGILSECLESELRAGQANLEVSSLDLAGRSAFESGSGMRGVQLRLLECLPAVVRRYVVSTMLGRLVRNKLMPRWRDALEGADAVIVGGGNLFSDVDLNFPMKINGALIEANRRGLPVAVYGVGVSPAWSQAAKNLFAEPLKRAWLVDVSARDERSCQSWNHLMMGTEITDARLSYDSGLLAVDHYPAAPRSVGIPHIGIGVTDPIALSYHGGNRQSRREFISKLSALVRSILTQGPAHISLFSNGSPEDQHFLAGLANNSELAAVTIVPRFGVPAELAYFLSSCDLVMAHRLHACIVTHSYGIPTVGFTWDIKVASFFERVGRPDYLAAFEDIDPTDLAQMARRAIAVGLDASAHDRMLTQGRADVASVRSKLIEAIKHGALKRPELATRSDA